MATTKTSTVSYTHLVQDAEQVVKVIAVILFLSRRGGLGRNGGVHAGAERLGEDGVRHDGVDLRLCGLNRLLHRLHRGSLLGADGLHRLRVLRRGGGCALGVHMRLNRLVHLRGCLLYTSHQIKSPEAFGFGAFYLVRGTGLEPVTSCTSSRCSTS